MSLANRIDTVPRADPNGTPMLVDVAEESDQPLLRPVRAKRFEQSQVALAVESVRVAVQEHLEKGDLSDERLRVLVEQETMRLAVSGNEGGHTEESRDLRRRVADELLGFGPLQDLLDDPAVSEIMINGYRDIFVERSGCLEKVESGFSSADHLRLIIDRMVLSSGRRVDQSSPMVDARLPNGSRLNVVLPPLAVDGASATIRKFTANHLTSDELVKVGALTDQSAAFLKDAVSQRLNILVSGGTGTGKTTLLNVLSSHIDGRERVITVEDAVELALVLPNLIRLEARPANSEGSGEVTIRDLVRNSLRMRPDRIVVGEVRGAEALDMLQAMNTGHDGSLSTLHANSPRDALRRLETMVLFGGIDLPLRAIREQVASAIDLVVQLQRESGGRRVVSSITEVIGLEGDVVTTADLFVRQQHSDGSSRLVSTGVASRTVKQETTSTAASAIGADGGAAAIGYQPLPADVQRSS